MPSEKEMALVADVIVAHLRSLLDEALRDGSRFESDFSAKVRNLGPDKDGYPQNELTGDYDMRITVRAATEQTEGAISMAADGPKPDRQFYVAITGGILLDLSRVSLFHNGRTLPGSKLVPLLELVLKAEGEEKAVLEGGPTSAEAAAELAAFGG